MIEQMIINNNKAIGIDDMLNHKIEIDLSKISRKAAVDKGIDYFIYLVIF